MRHIRRRLLTVLLLVVTAVGLAGHPRLSSAASNGFPLEPPAAPMAASPPQVPPDPNTGEPDSGSGRSTRLQQGGARPRTADQIKLAVRTLWLTRWSSLVWARHYLGVGE